MKTKYFSLSLGCLAAGCLLFTGCTLGKKSVLFTTKTSVALDIDAEPPTFDIGFSRKEGTVAPVYPTGEVLPQMASYHGDAGMFKLGAGQSFATGNAALLLAKYYSSPSDPDYLDQEILEAEIKNRSLATVPSSNNKKRYFFGTDTSFGAKIHFNAALSGAPTSFSVGYKRKEAAYTPIITTTNQDGELREGLPSLLGTSGLSVSAVTASGTSVRNSQFFATGAAAEYLAAQRAIRQSIGARIIDDSEAKAKVDARIKPLVATRLDTEEKFIKSIAKSVDNGSGNVDADKLKKLAKGTPLEGKTSSFEGKPVSTFEAKLRSSLRPFAEALSKNIKNP